jgi:hypothetical protein
MLLLLLLLLLLLVLLLLLLPLSLLLLGVIPTKGVGVGMLAAQITPAVAARVNKCRRLSLQARSLSAR